MPYQTKEFEVDVPFSLLARNTPEKVTVLIGTTKAEADTDKQLVIIYNLIVISVLFILVIGFMFFIVRKGLSRKNAKNSKEEDQLPKE